MQTTMNTLVADKLMSRRLWRAGVLVLILVLLGCAPGDAEAAEPGVMRVAGEELPALGFDFLAGFPYTIVDLGTGASAAEIEVAAKTDQVPATVRAFDGRRVVLTGYLLPLQIENGVSKKFILMRDVNTCCYGATPSMNDYVIVTMKGEGVKIVQDVPTQFLGVFRIEQKYEAGYVVSLYTLEGERLVGVKK